MEQRLEGVGSSLMHWSKTKFDDLGEQIKRLEKRLKEDQQKAATHERSVECSEIDKELEHLQDKHEAYWYLRGRV
ncbi:DNA double-strand break repair Rad50 ATPase [Bienertia sinuspersici]